VEEASSGPLHIHIGLPGHSILPQSTHVLGLAVLALQLPVPEAGLLQRFVLSRFEKL
jgi:hypothetical protein